MGDTDFPVVLAGKYMDDVMAKPQREALDLSRYRASGARKAFYNLPEKDNASRGTRELAEDQGTFRKYLQAG